MSRVMRKPAFCICENKDADQLRGNREADQRLCFRYIVQSLYFLNQKFQASRQLYSLVCVGPCLKPDCWFSHDTAQLYTSPQAGTLTKCIKIMFPIQAIKTSGPEVIKLFSWSTQLSMKFKLLRGHMLGNNSSLG